MTGAAPSADGVRRLGRSTAAALTIALGLLLPTALPASASPVTPRVSGISPGVGPTAGGTTVTITGEDFVAITGVKFGSREAASFEVVSSTEIVAVSPPWVSGNAIAEVAVETMSATSFDSIGDSFIYEPTVTKVEPAFGPAAGGTSVTISGEAFEGLFENGAGEMPPFVKSVQFGSHGASFKVESEGEITAVSPPGAGTVDVTLTTLGGTSAASPADRFTYATASPTGPPAIESESVSHITSTDATLEAQIDTEGLETTYTFYLGGPIPPCREAEPPCMIAERAPVPLPAGKLLGSFLGQSVSADLNSAGMALQPGGHYTYSVVATNAAGTTWGAGQRFIAAEEGIQPLSDAKPSSGPSSQITSPAYAKQPPSSVNGRVHARKHRRHRRHRHRGHPHAQAGARRD